jgi:putative flippase GtrA
LDQSETIGAIYATTRWANLCFSENMPRRQPRRPIIRAMASYGQLRVAGEPWRQTLRRNINLLRTDAVMAQGVRFVLCGAFVSLVYLTTTTLLSEVSHLRFQLALGIGWTAAVSVHFTLQRTFVWKRRNGFALPFARQVRRYLIVAVSQLAITAATTTVLPSALGVPAEAVYLATAVLVTLVNFLVFRNRVFHGEPAGVPGGGG